MYQGLVREIEEEAPSWQDYLLERVEADDVKCHIVETYNYDNPSNNRIEVIVFITIDINKLP